MDVVLDVDTGVDDALALLLAARHPDLDVHAVTCVAGNTSVEQVARNTLTVLDAAGARDVPVALGASRPLIDQARDATHVHGIDGMADLSDLPDKNRAPDPRHAVELLRDTIRQVGRPVTLIATAPLTNIALLARTHPDVVEALDRIIVMGGSAGIGNASPVAEFNTWHDPEAAAIVFDAGAPMTMYGLDVFYDVTVGAAAIERLAHSSDPAAKLAARLLNHQVGQSRDEPRVLDGRAPLGDAGAVCAALRPDLLRVERCPLRVELAPGHSRGQTLVDRRARPGEQERHGSASSAARHVDVAFGVDGESFGHLFVDTMLRRQAR